MNTHRAILSGLILLALTVGASDAWAQRGGPGGNRGMRGQLKSLNLSAQQSQQIGQLRSTMITRTAPIKAQLQVKGAELRALWAAPNPNRAAIVAKHNEVDALRRQLRDARIDFRLHLFRVLTPQQRAQLQSAQASRQNRGKRMHRQGMRRRQGVNPIAFSL